MHAVVLLLLLPLNALAWDSASTSVTSSDGLLTLTGIDSGAMHTHGGAPAHLGSAQFKISYTGETPRPLTVTKIAFLTGRDCSAPPSTVASEPTLGGLFLDNSDMIESKTRLELAPSTDDTVSVGFPAVEAYYTSCDRFAFQVTFRAGEEDLQVTAETLVTREEPIRTE